MFLQPQISWQRTFLVLAIFLIQACHRVHPPRHQLVPVSENLDEAERDNISQLLEFDSSGAIMLDSARIFRPRAIRDFYHKRKDQPFWSRAGRIIPAGDTMLSLVAGAWQKGLDPASLFQRQLEDLIPPGSRKTSRDAAVWARTDLLLTAAFTKMVSQLHYGILEADSLRLRKDTAFSNLSLDSLILRADQADSLSALVASVEPKYAQYALLKAALVRFTLAHGKSGWNSFSVDSLAPDALRQQLALRLLREGYLDSTKTGDQEAVTRALKRFQNDHGLFPDGKPGKRTLAALKVTSRQRLEQIRVNLDRWRHFPDFLPNPYLLVNIPAFQLEIWDRDSLMLESRVIVGKPQTPTPELSSSIVNFQLYPFWRLPMSIIVKDVFPALKRNMNYLTRNNLEVVDHHGDVVDPAKLNWKRFNKDYFPYVLRQMNGLDNSLGIIKFNFRNKYAVYLHDTNLRSLFGAEYRALSHGCVRVQKWDSLSRYLVRDDTLRHIPDSLVVWEKMQLQKEVNFSRRLPIYIRY
ncbi:MAG TPA: L,D-transpeptidase family protein, partial [Chitinophagaceae bacterium]|nr:L,D-transpeptidase family protein [Chitinophagaceae bacterium]